MTVLQADTALSEQELLDAYRVMRTIREFEDRLHVEMPKGEIPGFAHLYAGQEAIAAAVCMHLDDEDYVASTHRGHGHAIAKGCDVKAMMAEIYGRRTGLCHGKGGSMHVADLSQGMLGANAIVGAGPPLVCGVGLSARVRGTKNVGVAFQGDGATNQGTYLESLNLAAIWKLPVVFIVENNGYSEATATNYTHAIDTMAQRAEGFGVPAETVDGHDFFAVYEASGKAIQRARDGLGPTVVECTVIRYYGHFEGDTETYRAPNEATEVRSGPKDCLTQFAARTTESGILARSDIERIDAEERAHIDAAVNEAKQAPFPEADDLLTDVYVSY